MKKRLVFLLCIFIAACDNASDTPNNALQLSGSAAMGDLQLGTVTVYDYSECSKGDVLASKDLQKTGSFNFSIASTGVDRPVLVELSHFIYKEEWSDNLVDAGDKLLSSAVVLSVGTEQKVTISFWSNLAYALTAQKCSLGKVEAINVIEDSNDMFSTELTFDINHDTPVLVKNFISPAFTATELANMRYGIANAAIASYTYYFDQRNGETTVHNIYNSVSFAQAAFDDLVFEGILNGIAAGRSINFGDVALDMEIYRTVLPSNMDEIIANLTDLPENFDRSFLEGVVNKFHTANSEIFSFTQPMNSLGDTTAPVLIGKALTACGAGPIGKSGSETVYRNIVTVTYDIVDQESSITVTAANQAGVTIEVLNNGTVPLYSGLKPSVRFTYDSLHLTIPSTTVEFSNRSGDTISVATGMTTQPCGMF